MKTYTLDEVTDKYIGKIGTPKRDEFEQELQLDLLGEAINAKINFNVELLNQNVSFA